MRAEHKHLEDGIPLFDEYREFYEANCDHASARAFLTERTERDESVIFLAYSSRNEPVGFTQLYRRLLRIVKRLWILNDLSSVPMFGAAVWGAHFSNARDSTRSRRGPRGSFSAPPSQQTAQTLYESAGWRRDDEFIHYHLFF